MSMLDNGIAEELWQLLYCRLWKIILRLHVDINLFVSERNIFFGRMSVESVPKDLRQLRACLVCDEILICCFLNKFK